MSKDRYNELKEVRNILELAIGECEHIIPSWVLEKSIKYLDELKEKWVSDSWKYGEDMGR